MTSIIPVNEPSLGSNETEYVLECLSSGYISSAGRYIEEFERGWADYCGVRYGVAVSNGTAALQAAVAALDLKPGDEIILPTFTIISCALAILYNEAVPVLVDSDPVIWGMDVRQIASKISPRTRAIMAVHIYGHPVDMDPITALASRHGLAVIEDAAEAHGAEYLVDRHGTAPRWKRCGGLGTVSTFSFYANKLITTGEGGMVLTDDHDLAGRIRSLRNLCFRPDRRFLHSELGYNFRLTNLQAALGLAQLKRFGEIVGRKRRMGQAYTERLREIPGLQLPVESSWAKNVYWMYGVVLDEEYYRTDAAAFAEKLKERGVETRPFFLGMHEQPVFQQRALFLRESYPVAERLARQGLYLPSGLALTDGQLDEVCAAVKAVLG